jgi:hypothetical protein
MNIMNIIHTSVWLVVAAFLAAGLSNVIGKRATRESFVRWGYPSWWNWVTGGLELSTAILVSLPPARCAGLILGTTIMVAAMLTVMRHREFSHLVPIGVYLALIALAAFSS